MNKNNITIIDYGIGNLFSVARAFEYCGANIKIADNASQILEADRLVLPGVGAFFHAMEGLRKRNFIEPILEYFSKQRPFLGICVGMQVLLTDAHEFGHHMGLNIIPGTVEPIPEVSLNAHGVEIRHRIPNIGWLNLNQTKPWDGTILADVNEKDSFYFVHSYICTARKPVENLVAHANYEGVSIPSVISDGKNIFGTQFHLEKSGSSGLKIARNFIQRT